MRASLYALPRWELDHAALEANVKDLTSPALRSGICLGLGQNPVKRISKDDKKRLSELATQWYALPDSSTHSAAAWLLRQWEIAEPMVADTEQIVDGRNWMQNSQGVTFVLIKPPTVDRKPLSDPLEQVRQVLAQMENATHEEKAQPDFHYRRGRNLFLVGQYGPAWAELDAVSKMEFDVSMSEQLGEIELLRLLALARLKRTEEADTALAQWSASEPDAVHRDYVESLVPLWLGRKEVALARLEKGLAGVESADRGVRYKLACAVALFAASETATAEEKRSLTDRSVTQLVRWSQGDESSRNQMLSDPDLLVLHSDQRFVNLASEWSSVPEQPYWLANREVTRGEFESFLADTSYTGEKPTSATEASQDESISPTLDHPAQNVSWYDAVMYCNWLSRRESRNPAYRCVGKEKIKGLGDHVVERDKWEQVEGADGYRLPKDLEWEYACRAGSQTDWSSGSDESLIPAYCEMYPSKLASPCGRKRPNAWGMHDMHGNVYEWCWELYAPKKDSNRVIRGGSWYTTAHVCSSEFQSLFPPPSRTNYIGFRLALSSTGIPK